MPQRSQDIPSLKDLDGVRVAVDDPLPAGLSREALREAVEARLRTSSIRVHGMGDFPTGDPHLRVTVSASAPRDGLAAVSVQLDFVQIVFMRRNPQVTFNRAQTWKADAQVLLVAASSVEPAARAELLRQLDQFIADYRAANA
jgi:hypothetical protein